VSAANAATTRPGAASTRHITRVLLHRSTSTPEMRPTAIHPDQDSTVVKATCRGSVVMLVVSSGTAPE